MPDDTNKLYEHVCRHAAETAMLGSIKAVLEWDELTKMPAAASEYRAEQVTLMAGMHHRQWTDETFGQQLAELADSPLIADPHSDTGATIRRLKRQYDKKRKLPQTLVEQLARTAVLGQHGWQKARANDDFATFEPWLDKTIELKRQQAAAVGYQQCPYDALLDDYEPEARTAEVTDVLARLREQLVPLVGEIHQSARRPNPTILTRQFPIERQEAFGRKVAAAIGFDFARGRLDVTVHPFCTTLGPNDCRITTRYNDRQFGSALFGVIHEAGHGIYDQGLPTKHYGLPLGNAVSLGIHESQSRLWENMVARSHAFWEYFFDEAKQTFPEALSDMALDDFYFAVNDVRPSLVRVEADEATYNLHILVRFELEQAMLDGDLAAADLPSAWNEKYRQYLGIIPPDSTTGVLQDVHWSEGLIGYFPTYALGNLCAAQFFAAAENELGGLDAPFARGEFESLHHWLGKKIHQPGNRYSAAELLQRVTGEPLSPEPFVDYLRGKLGPLYGLN